MTHGNSVVRCLSRAALSLGGLWLANCMANVPAPKAQELPDTNWTLSALDGKPPLAGSSITLSFASGRVQGTDGCNRYSGPYTASGLTLVIGPEVVATMMACEPELMQQSSAYMQAIVSARSYRIGAGELQLLDSGGKLLARFAAKAQGLAEYRGALRAPGRRGARVNIDKLAESAHVARHVPVARGPWSIMVVRDAAAM